MKINKCKIKVIRQGHIPLNYYIFLSGVSLVTEASNQMHSTLKRGDCYGELDIIKNQRRTQTITVIGNTSCGLLLITKEDFFIIQTPISSAEERFKFLQNKVTFLKLISYPIDKLNKLDRVHCFSVYYRTGLFVLIPFLFSN
jgi:hypothetical protein